jgi:hypothetical protein
LEGVSVLRFHADFADVALRNGRKIHRVWLRQAVLIVCFGCLLSYGCGPTATGLPNVAPVSGTVTLNGEPLANASIVFESESGHSALGTTDAAGNFLLMAPGNQRGAVIGLNKVRITSQLDAPPAPNWRDPIPARYNSASELSAEVKAGENSFTFELQRKQ